MIDKTITVPEGVTLEQHLEDVIQTEDARLKRAIRNADEETSQLSAAKIMGYSRVLVRLQKTRTAPT